MDQNNRLNHQLIVYILVKIVQAVYQFGYLFILIGRGYWDEIDFIIVIAIIVVLISISRFSLRKYMDSIFMENTRCSEYATIIILGIISVFVALIGYPLAISQIKLKYGNDKEKLYYLHHCRDSGLKGNNLIKIPRYLDEETINEAIETTAKYLVEQAVNLRSNVISLVGIKENLSEPTDLSIDEYKVTMNPTSFQDPSQEMFEYYYDRYINVHLLIPSMFSLLIQLLEVGVLGWIEFIKYEIRKATSQQQAYEMGVMENAVAVPQDEVVVPQDEVVVPQDEVVVPQDEVVVPQNEVAVPEHGGVIMVHPVGIIGNQISVMANKLAGG